MAHAVRRIDAADSVHVVRREGTHVLVARRVVRVHRGVLVGRVRHPEEVTCLVRDDALEVVAVGRDGRRDRQRLIVTVDLHVRVVDLARQLVVCDGREREGVARIVVRPRVVAEDDDVLVGAVLVVLDEAAGDGPEVAYVDAHAPPLAAVVPRASVGAAPRADGPRPLRERGGDPLRCVVVGDLRARALLKVVAHARVRPVEGEPLRPAAAQARVVVGGDLGGRRPAEGVSGAWSSEGSE